MLSLRDLASNPKFLVRIVVWGVLAIFPVVFGYMTTVDGGVFMAIVSLLVGLVTTEVLLNDPETRAQGGSH